MTCRHILAKPRTATFAIGGALTLLLGGCSTLPSSGPTGPAILAGSTTMTDLQASIVELDAGTVDDANGASTSAVSPAKLANTGTVDRLGPGDVLQVSVFEIGTALFSAGLNVMTQERAGQPSAAGSALPLLTVSAGGSIVVPYIGELQVSGLTTQEVASLIERRLKGLSQHAQVTVAVKENIANSVFVLGGVKTPGRIPLSLGRERLLDAIALGGGTMSKAQDTTVRLTRAGQSAEIDLDGLLAGSPDDVVLLPGDRVEVLSPVQSFVVFGSTDKVTEIPFEMRHISLAQAVARTGGPSDRQADPTAVFIFRWAEPGGVGEKSRPIIYRLDMMRPESYFISQRFAMRNGDVIYIANAQSNQTTKLVQIVNLLFSPFYSFRQLTQ